MKAQLAAVVLTCLAINGCGDNTVPAPKSETAPATAHSGPFNIVATTGMVGDIVRQVVGDQGKVENLMGEGVDPHLYKPTRGDVAKILDADVIFYSGLMLEGRMVDTFVRAQREGKRVYPVTERIDKDTYLLEPEGFAGHWDPHVWMDVTAWSKCVEEVGEAMAEFDPTHADGYRQRSRDYRASLTKLDEYVKNVVASIPKDRRVLITAHDAFNYFGRAYDVDVRGIQGISTESEAGLEDINRLVDFIVQRKIAAVFVESSVSDKNVRALVEGATSRGHKISVGGKLFSDAMGKHGTYEGTYMGMIDHNATIIARALGGEAPERGMNGKLGTVP